MGTAPPPARPLTIDRKGFPPTFVSTSDSPREKPRISETSTTDLGSTPMRRLIPSLFFILLALPATAESRMWKSSDGQRTIQGELLKRDKTNVTILREDGQEITFSLDKLHADDRKWLDKNHPPAPPPTGVFDTLVFGDDRDEVFKKLKASNVVELIVEERFLGRFGLNGMFRTRKAAGGLHSTLFFDWTGGGGLTEVSLQTENLPISDYESKLKPCWEDYIELLTQIYGSPAQTSPLSPPEKLESGAMLASHLWRLESGGTTLLGISREGNGYQIFVRITREIIQPTFIPNTGGAPPPVPTFFDP